MNDNEYENDYSESPEANLTSEPENEPSSESEETPETSSEPVTYEVTVTSEPRPFLTTDFADYSVSEGLLLLLLLLAFISGTYNILRRAFSWLL